MSIRLGTTDPSAFRLGNTAVSKLMLGTTEVWSAFSGPLAYSPLLWLDGSDGNTMFAAASGGSLVANNGVIRRWEDKSGNGRHATSSTSVSTKIDNQRNGLSIVNLPATNTFANALGGNHPAITEITSFAVYKINGTPSVAGFIISAGVSGNSTAANRSHQFTYDLTNSYFNGNVAGAPSASMSATRNLDWNIHTGACPPISGESIYRINEAQVATKTSTANNYPTAAQIYKIGYASWATANLHAIASLAEIICYPSRLTDQQIANVENYLATKWGI